MSTIQKVSDMPKPSQPMDTKKMVTLAMVATVIHPKYTLKGNRTNHRSRSDKPLVLVI